MKLKIDLYQIFLHIALIVLAVTVFILVNKNNECKSLLTKKVFAQLREGDSFNQLSLVDLSKKTNKVLSPDSKNKILYVFSTDCPYCSDNLPYWKSFFNDYKDKFEFIGISIDGFEDTKKYKSINQLTYSIFLPELPDFRETHKISGVPQTIVIDDSNKVVKYWLGALKSEDIEEINAYLKNK